MNNNFCCMVNVIIKDHENSVDAILTSLYKAILPYWSNSTITLVSCLDYWKESGYKTIIYGVTLHKPISVDEFIKIFHITWDYSEVDVYNIETKMEYNNKNAMWDQRSNPAEMFLIPQVEWVHIFTWPCSY